MIDVGLAGIGLLGPGLADWATARPLLVEPGAWSAAPTVLPAPTRLPANERRRAGALIKAAIAVADQAVALAGLDAAAPATVFTSSTSDPLVCHQICEALALPERAVSPTRFTNSVHNAAAGYWHIATQSMQASTSLAAFDASFGAGLLEAAVQCLHAAHPVLLVAADVPYPEPLQTLRPLQQAFAVALLLTPGPARWRLRLDLEDAAGAPAGIARCDHAGFEALRRESSAARALPLLQALAADRQATLSIEAADGWPIRVTAGPTA